MTEKNDCYEVISTTQDKNRALSSKNKPGTNFLDVPVQNSPIYNTPDQISDLKKLTGPSEYYPHTNLACILPLSRYFVNYTIEANLGLDARLTL